MIDSGNDGVGDVTTRDSDTASQEAIFKRRNLTLAPASHWATSPTNLDLWIIHLRPKQRGRVSASRSSVFGRCLLAPLAAGSPRCFFPATPLSLVGSWLRLRSFPGSLPVARQLSSSLLVSFPHHLRGISIGDEAVFQRRTGWIRFEESRRLAFLLAGAQLRYSIFRDSLDDGQGDGGWERHKGRVEKSPHGRGAWSLTHWCAIN